MKIFRLLACFTGTALALAAQDWAPNVTTAATWVDNAANANVAADRIGALRLDADVVSSHRVGLGRDDSVNFGPHLAGEWWPHFGGLNLATLGARAEWQHKFGLGALAPVARIEVEAAAIIANESAREGTATGLTLGLSKRFDPATRLALTEEFATHDARAAAFDRSGAETKFKLDRDLDESTRVSFTVRWRDGDVLSYATPPRPELVALAPHRLTVTTFGAPRVAYSIRAHTIAGVLAYARALDQQRAIVFSYEWRATTRDPIRYVNQLVSLALVHQF